MTRLKSGSFEVLRCLTKSTRPPEYLYVCSSFGSVRSSVKRISRPLLRKAISRSRSRIVWARNSVSSNTVASGQKVMVVPVCFDGLTRRSFPWGLPPFANSWTQRPPSRLISITSRLDSALTTDTPTPCNPPEILYPSPPNFAPACNVVMMTSAADLFRYSRWLSTGMPRPLSETRHPPSASNVTSILVASPAIASSTELSTTSYTRWCSPDGPVDPMYMPGRSRTGSRPLSTVMSLAVYATRGAFLVGVRGRGAVRPDEGVDPAKLLVRTPKPLSSLYQTTSPGTAFPDVVSRRFSARAARSVNRRAPATRARRRRPPTTPPARRARLPGSPAGCRPGRGRPPRAGRRHPATAAGNGAPLPGRPGSPIPG